jgi:glycosyltransferase involved in cell wall biosynthesis
MRIALDARTIYQPARRGIGKTLVELYRHVAALRPDWSVLALHRGGAPAGAEPGAPGLPPNIHPHRIEMLGDRADAWLRLRLPLAAWRGGADLLHCPANRCPSWLPLPTVVTIHDLIPLDQPDAYDPALVRRFERSVAVACRRAAWVLCPSAYTRDQLVARYGANAQRITVNPWAPLSSLGRPPTEAPAALLARYGVTQPFVLHFGSTEPRKNSHRLIEAWAATERTARRGWQLLIVGLNGLNPGTSACAALATAAQRLGVGDSVLLRGFAPESDLPGLLAAAGVLAYPSLAEGFGLPILDAWASDLPVLTGNRTSLPEVAGDAALLVDPLDPCAMARGLAHLMQDAQLREDLVARGRVRRQTYSWPATAARFIDTLETVAAAGTRRRAA